MQERTDAQLVADLNRGRSQALDELYRRHAASLFVFCSRAMSARQPEDVVHDVFLRVIEASRQFDLVKGSFRAWLLQIARNRCIDLARREQRVGFASLQAGVGQDCEEDETLEQVIARDEPRVEDLAMRPAIADAVRSCLAELRRPEQRQAVVLFYLAGKVYREIGEILGKSTSMARKWVQLARESLQRCLRRKGFAV